MYVRGLCRDLVNIYASSLVVFWCQWDAIRLSLVLLGVCGKKKTGIYCQGQKDDMDGNPSLHPMYNEMLQRFCNQKYKDKIINEENARNVLENRDNQVANMLGYVGGTYRLCKW